MSTDSRSLSRRRIATGFIPFSIAGRAVPMTDFEQFTTSLDMPLVVLDLTQKGNTPPGGFRTVCTEDWLGSPWRQSCERSRPYFEKRVSSPSTRH